MGIAYLHLTNLFRTEFGQFGYFIWKKAPLKQIGNTEDLIHRLQS